MSKSNLTYIIFVKYNRLNKNIKFTICYPNMSLYKTYSFWKFWIKKKSERRDVVSIYVYIELFIKILLELNFRYLIFIYDKLFYYKYFKRLYFKLRYNNILFYLIILRKNRKYWFFRKWRKRFR